MKDVFVKSSPRFFRLLVRSALLFTALLLVAAALCPAPLQEAASPALTPNPVKSAWFLLWIQELVSWSRLMIWPVIVSGTLFFFLPWLPGQMRTHQASWFAPGQRRIALLTLLVWSGIVILTLIAMFLRGANWALIF
jgi:hypothetical protein